MNIERYGRKEIWPILDVLKFHCQGIKTKIRHTLQKNYMFENSPHPMMKVNSMGKIVGTNYAFTFQFKNEEKTIKCLNIPPEQSVYIGDQIYYIERILVEDGALVYEFKDETASRTDHLTGLRNKLAFEEDMQKTISVVNRNKDESALVVFMDLNHFKKVNDKRGHEMGDCALIGFAKILKKCLRDTDGIYRRSGDEFIIILRNCTPEQWQVLEARIRRELQPLCDDIGVEGFGFSAGSLEYDPSKFSTVSVFMHETDERMYTQKNFHKAREAIEREDWMEALERLAEAVDHMKRVGDWKITDYTEVQAVVIINRYSLDEALDDMYRFAVQNPKINTKHLDLLKMNLKYLAGEVNTIHLESARRQEKD